MLEIPGLVTLAFLMSVLLNALVSVTICGFRFRKTERLIAGEFILLHKFLKETVLAPEEDTPELPGQGPYRNPADVLLMPPSSGERQWQFGCECPKCGKDEDDAIGQVLPQGDEVFTKAKWECNLCGCSWESEPLYKTKEVTVKCSKCNLELSRVWYCSACGTLPNSEVSEHNEQS